CRNQPGSSGAKCSRIEDRKCAFPYATLTNRHKVIVAEERPDEAFAGAQARLQRWRHAGVALGRLQFDPAEQLLLLAQEFGTGGLFWAARPPRQNLLKRSRDKRGLKLSILLLCRRQAAAQPAGQQSALVEQELTIGQEQCLLRDDALAAPVAVARIRGIEEREHLQVAAVFGVNAEIEAAPPGSRIFDTVQHWTADAGVELAGD